MTKEYTRWLTLGIATLAMMGATLSPAQSRSTLDQLSRQRQQTKNEWRNIAIASGALAAIGLLSDDSTLTFVGAAGALYSTYRYEQDRKSQSKTDRLRAAYFSRPYFVRNGVRYNRQTVKKNGKSYYQFVRVAKANPPKKNGRHDNGRRGKNG